MAAQRQADWCAWFHTWRTIRSSDVLVDVTEPLDVEASLAGGVGTELVEQRISRSVGVVDSVEGDRVAR